MAAPAPPRSSRRGRRRPGVVLLVLLAGLAVVALLERARRDEQARRLFPPSGAEWIWHLPAADAALPTAVMAVRDVEIDAVPEDASLVLAADEQYVAFVNGRRVGSGSWRAGELAHRWRVAPYLVAGPNRVAVEVRSARGAGGLLVCLQSGGQCLVASDRSWRTFSEAVPGVAAGWAPADTGSAAFSWGRAPLGSWGTAAENTLRPSLDDCRIDRQPVPGTARGEVAAEAESPAGTLWEWSDEALALVDVVLPAESEIGDPFRARLAVGESAAEARRAPGALTVLLARGRRWRAVAPGRGRWAVLSGLPADAVPWRIRLDPECAGELPVLSPALGLLGLNPPRPLPRRLE